MSTSAGIEFMNNEYCSTHDGTPEDIIPYLKDMVKSARAYAKEHLMDFEEAMWITLEKECKEGTISHTNLGVFYSNYEYQITDEGEVQMLSADGETWSDYNSLKEEYTTLIMAEELDDVDVSLSTALARSKRIREIQSIVPDSIVETWGEEIEKELADPETTLASGAKYN